jgi:hypothetical protein
MLLDGDLCREFLAGRSQCHRFKVGRDSTFSHDFYSILNGGWIPCYSFLVLTWDAWDFYVCNGLATIPSQFVLV